MEGAGGAVDRPMAAATLKGALGLRSEPVAVKFFTHEVELPGFVKPGEQRCCRMRTGAAQARMEGFACEAAPGGMRARSGKGGPQAQARPGGPAR
jgi:uncharacterized protein (DUF169 family)